MIETGQKETPAAKCCQGSSETMSAVVALAPGHLVDDHDGRCFGFG
jgi:hypothetical protein